MIEHLFIFAKAQVSSFIGGIVDYLIMILLTEFLDVPYTISIVIGGIVGAVVNFSLNKSWTFHSRKLPYKFPVWKQFSRFVLMVLNSIVLKTSGTYFITSFMKIDYKLSRIITDLFVSIVFNFMLQRHWIFRKVHS
ncbi:MAG: GtrA family protein [Bacteroidales bacterium]|nr:GtrA family protein [Bacteroidales bacterium]